MWKPVRPATWWYDVALVAGLALLTLALAARTPLLGVDLAVRDWCDAHRPAAGYWLARGGNLLGQGGAVLVPLTALIAVWLAYRRRSLRPFLPGIAAFVLLYGTVGPLKLWTDRYAASKRGDPHPEWLFHAPAGESYPSGHVVNAIVWYGVIVLLLANVLPGRWQLAIRMGVPALLVCTTTYLSYHWLTDGLAAIMLGIVLDRLIHRVSWEDIPLGRLR